MFLLVFDHFFHDFCSMAARYGLARGGLTLDARGVRRETINRSATGWKVAGGTILLCREVDLCNVCYDYTFTPSYPLILLGT